MAQDTTLAALRERRDAAARAYEAAQAELYEAEGNRAGARFYRALAEQRPTAEVDEAYIALRAEQFLERPQHVSGETAEMQKRIEDEAARLRVGAWLLGQCPETATVAQARATLLGAALFTDPHACVCAGLGRIGDNPCPHCDAGKAGRAA